MNFNIFHLFVVILVPGVLSSPLKRIRRNVSGNDSPLLPPNHNACAAPVQSSVVASDGGVIDDMMGYLEHLRESSLEVRDQIEQEISRMERRINCQHVVEGMSELDVDNFLNIESGLGHYQNNVTRMYSEMRTLLYLFEILTSPRLEQCCIHTSRFYFRLQNRLVQKWFIIQEQNGQTIQNRHCCLAGSDVINRSLTCELLRDIVYTVLKEGTTTLGRSIDYLQEKIQTGHL